MPVGELLVRISASTAEFKSDLGKAVAAAEFSSRQIDKAIGRVGVSIKSALASSAGALGLTFGVGGAAAFVKSTIDSAEALSELSDRSGVAVETLAGLDFAAQQTGSSIDEFAIGLKNLNKNISEAGTGDKNIKNLFNDLGLEDAAKGLGTAEDALLKLAEVFPRLSEADQTGVALKLLGKSGEALKPALAGGREALEELIAEGKRLNPVTTEAAKQADAFNDNLAKLQASSTLLGRSLALETLPALEAITSTMADAAKESGVLKAIWVGLGGIGSAVFTDDLLTGSQKARNEIAKINEEIEKLQSGKSSPSSFLDNLFSNDEEKAARLEQSVAFLIQQRKVLQTVIDRENSVERPKKQKPDKALVDDSARKAADDNEKKAQQAAEAARKRAKDFIADLEKQRDTIGLSEEAQKSYEASVLSTTLAKGKERDAFLESSRSLIDDLKASKAREQLNEVAKKNAEEAAEAQSKWATSLEEATAKEEELLETQLRANEVFGKSTAQIIELEIARKRATLAAVEAQSADEASAEAIRKQSNELEKQIAALEKRKGAVVTGDKLAEDKKAYEDFFSSVESAGREAFRNFGQEGESVAERLKNALKESVYDMLYQITVKKWIIDIQANLSGSGGGKSSGTNWVSLIGSFFGGGGGGEWTSGYDLQAASGAAIDNGVKRYASGGVVSRPTLFRMANGAGLMGEAGPEGILPLQRMGDGRLGVSTSGIDGGGGITVIQNNTFNGGSDKATLAAWAAQVKQETMRAVSSEISRNGPMAKVVRSA